MSLTIDKLATPSVLIDIDRVRANLRRAQDYADTHGLRLRPHIKTHKVPALARLQVELGACGITCQKLSEAEVMADAGLSDIFISYNIVGADKLSRLTALARRITLSVAADSAYTVSGYIDAARAADVTLTVLVECDTGAGRCGVATADAALDLARRLEGASHARFGGLMTYPKAGGTEQTAAWIAGALDLFARAGMAVPVVSSGGTPDMWRAHLVPGVTEYRPGTYIYMDRSQVAAGAATLDECALTVQATVVSRPSETRAVLDAGTKTLTSDLLGLDGFGHVLSCPSARVDALSEEHGVIQADAEVLPALGERVRIVPNHACVVSNMFDRVYFVSGDTVLDAVPVAARGCVT
ncbi:D-TA family PLP-dependent enzyme [Gluconacetobacter tumulisoli]|uniref:D-TA family PLP-dependent enzyme n=1 Tax=Gluconacetobacter tumulisoli TaxID=1286189 RepID=A0A7W4PP68_9PROT|nr:D-TA family PLP-dependent enzyme [Gluconacetobacter tumulisoli]MBB2201521.1 D-TA family PLP-dependent enzyme [Gluconacetobacter tumulisoli]